MEEKKQNDKLLNKDFKVPKLRFPGYKEFWLKEDIWNKYEIIMGQSPNSKFYNFNKIGLPLIQGNTDIKNGYSVSLRYTSQITKIAKKGSIVLTVRAPVGIVGILVEDSCIGRGVCSIKADKFLYYFLLGKQSKRKNISQGSTFDSINRNDFVLLKYYEPKFCEERNKIISFLDLTIKKHDLISKKIFVLKKYKKGIIHNLIKTGFLASKIKDLVKVEKKTGLASSHGKKLGSYPFFINNDDGVAKYCNEYLFDGQYLILNTGGTASVKYYDGKFSAMSDCLILKPIAHAIGLYYFLVANEEKINITCFQGTGLKHLDQKWFFNLKVKLPKLSDTELNNFNELIESQIQSLTKKVKLMKSFKQYLLANMFI